MVDNAPGTFDKHPRFSYSGTTFQPGIIQPAMPPKHLLIDADRCKGCGLCIAVCPRQLLRLGDKPNRPGQLPVVLIEGGELACTSCACCARSCPDLAISVFRPDPSGKDDPNA